MGNHRVTFVAGFKNHFGMGMNDMKDIEEVESELRSLVAAIEGMQGELDKVTAERDALAARCDRLTLLLSQISTATEGGYNLDGDEIADIDALLLEDERKQRNQGQ